MSTVAELIEYLQRLPLETDVQIAVAVDAGYSRYSTFEDLQLPKVKEDESDRCFSNNDHIEYYNTDNEPTLWIGRI